MPRKASPVLGHQARFDWRDDFTVAGLVDTLARARAQAAIVRLIWDPNQPQKVEGCEGPDAASLTRDALLRLGLPSNQPYGVLSADGRLTVDVGALTRMMTLAMADFTREALEADRLARVRADCKASETGVKRRKAMADAKRSRILEALRRAPDPWDRTLCQNIADAEAVSARLVRAIRKKHDHDLRRHVAIRAADRRKARRP